MKLVALALGLILWTVVHFDDSQPSTSPIVTPTVEKKTFNAVKVQTYGLNANNYVQSVVPESVKLTVQGSPSDLRKATTEDYLVRVDLSTVTEGQHTLKLQANLPSGVNLVSMTPDTVTVNVEELQTKEFEADVTTTGQPAEGFKAGIPVLKPTNRVHVTLPSSKLAKVARVGGTVSVQGLSQSVKSKSIKLAAYDADGKVIEGALLDPAVLDVDVPITNPYKTVPVQFKLVGQLPSGLSISSFKPETEQVTIYGPQAVLDTVEFVEADVQLGTLTKSGQLEIKLKSIDQITEFSPDTVIVDVKVVLSQTRTIQGLPVTIEGLGAGLTAKITDPATQKVDITMQGAPAMLDSLQPGDVDVVADLSGRGPGVYTVPIVVNSPRFIDQVGGNMTVTVEISSDQPASATTGEPSSGGGSSEGAAGDSTSGSAVDGGADAAGAGGTDANSEAAGSGTEAGGSSKASEPPAS